MSTPVIRIATRGSAQAVTQAEHVADLLRREGLLVELVLIDTHGDRTQSANVPLHTIGGQGVFVKEVQLAVLDGRADVAVHSAKDLPTTPHEGLVIGAYTRRRSAADALVGRPLVDLSSEATVATGSVRRRAQLHRARPDLEFVELRGNIHTRPGKVPEGGSIVTIGDWATRRPYPNYAAYFVGKGAIPTITRSLAVELARRNPNVRVNCILPGPVMLPEDLDEAETKGAVAGTLLKRAGRPENVARAVVFLVENDFVTGVCLPVDGGRTIAM